MLFVKYFNTIPQHSLSSYTISHYPTTFSPILTLSTTFPIIPYYLTTFSPILHHSPTFDKIIFRQEIFVICCQIKNLSFAVLSIWYYQSIIINLILSISYYQYLNINLLLSTCYYHYLIIIMILSLSYYQSDIIILIITKLFSIDIHL